MASHGELNPERLEPNRSCLIFFGEASLRYAVRLYTAHDRLERNHLDANNQFLMPLRMMSSIQLAQFAVILGPAAC